MPKHKKTPAIQMLAGTYDILPEDQKYWRYVHKKLAALLEDYGFERLETPYLEPAETFLGSFGDSADILGDGLVMPKLDLPIAVRYGGTAPITRAYIEHGMQNRPHPVKLFTIGQIFSRDGKNVRQMHQLAIQSIGDSSEVIDAELLFLAYRIAESFSLQEQTIYINSLGDNNCRPAYIRALKDFYKLRSKKLCAKCRNDIKISPLRLLSCPEPACRQAIQNAPQMIDFLDDECKSHFKHILEFLDLAKVPYILDPYMVNGAGMLNRTVFEMRAGYSDTAEAPVLPPLISGGRQDELSAMLGGRKVPAAGWILDTGRLAGMLKEKNANVPEVGIKPKVFLVQLGEAAKRKSLLLFEDVRKSGIEIKFLPSRDNIKSQLRVAARLGVRFTLIFGQKEALEDTVILREMEAGTQETIPLEKIVDELKKRLKR